MFAGRFGAGADERALAEAAAQIAKVAEPDAVDLLLERVLATGRCLNRLAFFINPNLFTVNCLTEWSFGGISGFGEDHDNWSAPAARRFFRAR